MGFETAPFDVVEASRRVWLQRWSPESASGMATYVAILRSYQLLNSQVNEVMRQFDLSFARYEVLSWLATDPESSLALSWISKTLRIPPATVTGTIDRLEADGLVARVPHATDARTTLAQITPAGRKLETAATRALNASVYEAIGLSGSEREQLVDLLATLRAQGQEFDVEQSAKVVEDVTARHARPRRARKAKGDSA